jgi:hypothetical protein
MIISIIGNKTLKIFSLEDKINKFDRMVFVYLYKRAD